MDTQPTALQEVVNRSTEEGGKKIYEVQNQPVPMVIFHAGSAIKSLQYFDLHEIQFDRDAPDTLTCLFSEWEIVVTGRRLMPLLEDLSRHAVFRLIADKHYESRPENEEATFATNVEFIQRVEIPGVRNSKEELSSEGLEQV
jgi:hypothetical protein